MSPRMNTFLILDDPSTLLEYSPDPLQVTCGGLEDVGKVLG
jgi:hypothetical protein